MGSHTIGQDARIYYYPTPDSTPTLVTISLSDIPSECDIQPFHNAGAGQAQGGGLSTGMNGGWWRVRLTLERFFDTDGGRVAQLQTLLSHLCRGHSIALSLDHNRTWAAAASSAPSAGATSIATGGNLYTAYSSGSISAGDHVIVQSPNPYFYHEQRKVSSFVTNTVGLVGYPTRYDHEADTLVRWEGFFPHLRLDPAARNSGRLLLSERRKVWTLDLPLISQTADEHADLEQE